MKFVDQDLLSIQEARILMENAREARKVLSQFPQEKLDEITDSMAAGMKNQLEELARMSVEETGYGNWKDEYVLLKFLCESLPARLKNLRCVGILKEDKQNRTMDIGVPLGVITAVCPPVSPVSAVFTAALNSIKSGNGAVIAPHKRAEKTTRKTVELLAEKAEEAGLPKGALTVLETVTDQGIHELAESPETSLVLNIGVPDMFSSAAHTGKPVIYGGTGPSPVFIERTADVRQAAEDIVASRSFDNGMLSGAEQYVVADSLVAAEVRRELAAQGAWFMKEEEERKLIGLICPGSGGCDPEYIGKSAVWLAGKAGFQVPEGTRVLVSEQRYISDRNPFAQELRCPVLAYYIEHDWMHACEKCMELLVHESQGHTLVIHSKDEEVIRQFALKKPVGRILVNTPAALGAMGATTNLFPAAALGAMSAGMGITADNVSPMNLIYTRRVGYGVKKASELADKVECIVDNTNYNRVNQENEPDMTELFRQILKRISQEL